MQRSVVRSMADPPPAVPVALRSATPYVKLCAGRFGLPSGNRVTLAKWVLKGRAMIEVRGERIPFGPGDLALHFPIIPHAFWVLEEGTEMCWFSVDGPIAEPFTMGLGLRPGVYAFGEAPVNELQKLYDAIKDPSVQGYRDGSLMALKILYEIAGRIDVKKEEIPDVVRVAQQMIHERLADPNLSISSLAERLNYHRGSLSRRFHQVTGVTFAHYLAHVRLQEAQMLLGETSHKIAAVARKCGIRDHIYFCRWFRQHTGLTPQEFRNECGQTKRQGGDHQSLEIP
jgi:AraC-like DNA-binding protein